MHNHASEKVDLGNAKIAVKLNCRLNSSLTPLFQAASMYWFYYMLKIADLLDTVSSNRGRCAALCVFQNSSTGYVDPLCFYFMFQVFFVLRKKNRQISFLHIYHHTGMILIGYSSTKFLAGRKANTGIFFL